MQSMTLQALVFLAILIQPGSEDESASGHLKKAKEAFEQSHFKEAFGHVESAIRLDRKNPEAYFLRAQLQVLDLKYDEAIADLTEVIALNPRFPKAHNERAFRYIMKEEWDKAEQDYTEAIRIDPRDPEPLVSRSMIYYDKKQYDKALADARKAVEVSKGKDGHKNLALMLATCPDSKYRDGKKALEHAKRAVELASGKNGLQGLAGLESLAAAYAELGQFDEAIKWQKKEIDALEKEGSTLLESTIKQRTAWLKFYEAGKALRMRYMYEREEEKKG
jgi:tetratricopeptide (TPR) repeat protein